MTFLKLLFNRVFNVTKQKSDPKISLLVPFSKGNSSVRKRNFKWLQKYWKHELPEAELIVGYSNSKVFCKGEALNNAAKKAKGKVLVIIDADAYISGKVLDYCADRIIAKAHNKLWYVPYRNLYRLNRNITEQILKSNPADPLRLPSPPLPEHRDQLGHHSQYGHRYGAMCMMFPREALATLGGFDERFHGWGGEDVALLRSLDTLYGKHKTVNNDILHLWHPMIGNTYQTRIWKGQTKPSPNSNLANKYHQATRKPAQMRALVAAGQEARKQNKKTWFNKYIWWFK